MTSQDKFEAWASEHLPHLYLTKTDEGAYASPITRTCFVGWSARDGEVDGLRKDAERWQCVRNAIPMKSPYAIWREGSHLVLGKDADELVDNFLSHAKEAEV